MVWEVEMGGRRPGGGGGGIALYWVEWLGKKE